MRSKAEVTTRYAKAYVNGRKKDKGRVLDEVVSVTGWSRDNARRRLTSAAKQPPGSGRAVAPRARKPRAQLYSYDARKVLQKVWAASGGQCGKYLERVDAHPARRARAARRAHARARPVQRAAACRAARHVRGDDRPVPGPGQGEGPDRRRVDDQAVAAAALEHHDPQGRGRGGGRARVLRGRHRRPLRPHPQGRVRPHGEPDRRADRVGVHPVGPQQLQHPHPVRAASRRGRNPLRNNRSRLRQRIRVPQPPGHRVGLGTEDLLHQVQAVQEERPGHHRVQEQPPRAQVRLPTTATTPRKNAAC